MPLVAPADDVRAGDGPPVRPFAVVLEDVLRGDLAMAANSNLRSAGGWTTAPSAVSDVDGDRSLLCVRRTGAPAACADNSSSARLDLPRGSRVVHARLYVETSLSERAGPLHVRLAGPAAPFEYTRLGNHRRHEPRLLHEDSAAMSSRAVLRQAVWDITEYVAANGAGRYTVADIVGERAGSYLPYSSWAIVAAYELDPAVDLDALSPELRPRFASRAIAWHDGFVLMAGGARAVPVAELAVTPAAAVFAKSLHIVAPARRGEADNLLFNGRPLGNNVTPGDRPPPPGVRLGPDRSCNSTTDVFNETICALGAPVRSRAPGPARFIASSDGATSSSASGVDVDVVRVPDRYLVAGSTSSVMSVSTADEPLAVGMLAISADLPRTGS